MNKTSLIALFSLVLLAQANVNAMCFAQEEEDEAAAQQAPKAPVRPAPVDEDEELYGEQN